MKAAKEIKEIDDFLRGSSQWMRIEVNFIIDNFLKLPPEEKKEIYNQLKLGDEEQFLLAAKKLIKFVQDSLVEIAKSISEGMIIPPWKIPDSELERKMYYVGMYFKAHLNEQLIIEKIAN